MIRYHSRRERRSRLESQENKRFIRQTFLIIFTTIALLAGIVFLGIPAFIKFAVFLGNLRSNSQPVAQTDTIPPATPLLDPIVPATASAKLDLSGSSEASSTVHLYINGIKETDTAANGAGDFVFTGIGLVKGLNRFYVNALDRSGNESLPSSTQSIVYDSDAPTLSVSSPSDGQAFYGPTVLVISVKGLTDPDNSLTMNDRLVVVQSDGTFNDRIELQEGDNHLKFSATDRAGNVTTADLTVKYSR